VRALVAVALLAAASAQSSARLTAGPTTGISPASVADAFDDAWQRRRAGSTFGAEKTGAFQVRYPFRNGVEFENWIDVPADYDPARRWPLRVQLHGGVGRPAPNAVPPGQPKPAGLPPNRIAGEKQIYVHPSAWADAEWWDAVQVDNILRLIADMKSRYNIDESRIYLTGISDGGTGAYYLAMREPTLWASVLPLNGSVAVLRSPSTGVEGELYGNNLVNKPLYIVNGEQDPLYPVYSVEPHIQWFESLGVSLVFRPQAGAGHNTAWWPTERERFETFVRDHPRQPHPAKLSWETERSDRFNRVHWLVIDRLGAGTSDAALEDARFFFHSAPSGRVDIERAGNTFVASSRGVRSFTLLLSPDVMDFAQPVVVRVNGKELFHGPVKKDVAVLEKWAARDHDRTMLYAAELKVDVP
jgi:poly(3-hydroxybutyrate) depolymerase